MGGKYITRHGAMRFLGEFTAGEDTEYARGDAVVVRTDRGLELGEILCETTPRAVALLAEPTHGQIVRRMAEQDHAELDRIRGAEVQEFESCNRFIAQRRLQMELVDVEHRPVRSAGRRHGPAGRPGPGASGG